MNDPPPAVTPVVDYRAANRSTLTTDCPLWLNAIPGVCLVVQVPVFILAAIADVYLTAGGDAPPAAGKMYHFFFLLIVFLPIEIGALVALRSLQRFGVGWKNLVGLTCGAVDLLMLVGLLGAVLLTGL